MPKPKRKMNEATLENDLPYEGPLSYRMLRIIGWAAIVLSQIAVILAYMAKHWSEERHNLLALSGWSNALSILGGLSVPLFLVANFAIILQRKDRIKQLMLTHLGFALLIAALFELVYYRYLTGLLHVGLGDKFQETLDAILTTFLGKKLSFNVFIDLLIYSSFQFFFTYTPRKVFTGKKIAFFRAFVAFPIAYELFSILMKGLAGSGVIGALPMWIMPFFASKPLLSFLAFGSIIVYWSLQKRIYLKHGGTAEGYQEFQKTRYHSFHFSKFAAIVFAVTAAIDLTVFTTFCIVFSAQNPGAYESTTALLKDVQSRTYCWGVGDSIQLLIGAPVILLFSYRKTHSIESKNWDTIIPLIGIVVVILTYLEGIYCFFVFK